LDDVFEKIAELESEMSAVNSQLASHEMKSKARVAAEDASEARRKLSKAQAEVLDLEERISQLESEAAPVRERISSLQRSSPSGSYKDEEAKEHQSQVSKARLEELEERELELMESLEIARAEVAELERELESAKQLFDQLQSSWSETESGLKAILAQKREALESLLRELSDPDRERYMLLSKQLQGSVFAFVSNSVCGHCGLSVSTKIIGRLKSQGQSSLSVMERCEECDRVLLIR